MTGRDGASSFFRITATREQSTWTINRLSGKVISALRASQSAHWSATANCGPSLSEKAPGYLSVAFSTRSVADLPRPHGQHPGRRATARRLNRSDSSEKDRAEVQKTMLGPEALDSERHQEIVFKSIAAESVRQEKWTLRGNLTLHGQTRPVTVHVMLKDGRYTGEALVKQTDFGIKPLGKAGVKAKDEVRIDFDVRLLS